MSRVAVALSLSVGAENCLGDRGGDRILGAPKPKSFSLAEDIDDTRDGKVDALLAIAGEENEETYDILPVDGGERCGLCDSMDWWPSNFVRAVSVSIVKPLVEDSQGYGSLGGIEKTFDQVCMLCACAQKVALHIEMTGYSLSSQAEVLLQECSNRSDPKNSNLVVERNIQGCTLVVHRQNLQAHG